MAYTIDQLLERAEMAIEGTLENPGILKRTTVFGYDRKRMLEGRTMLNQTRMLISDKNQKRGARKDASKTMKADRQLARSNYMHHLTLARLVVDKDSGMWEKLHLSGTRKQTIAGWLEQARSFYQELGQDEAILGKIRVSPEEIAQAKAMVDAVWAARKQYKFCMGESQQSTQTCQRSLEALEAWLRNFFKVASVALEGQEQMLEALGVVVKA